MAELHTETVTPLQQFVVLMDKVNDDDSPETMDVQISDLGIMLEAFRGEEFQSKDEVIGSLSVTWRDVYSWLETRKAMEE